MNATTAAAAELVGTGFSAYGAYRSGSEENKLYKQRASALEADAMAVEASSLEEARRKRIEGQKITARQKAVAAKSGVRLEGSPLLVIEDSMAEVERDAGLIRHEGLTQGSRLRSQAGWERAMGKSKYKAGLWGAASSLLAGGSRFYMQGYDRGWWGKPKSQKGLGIGIGGSGTGGYSPGGNMYT